VDSLVDSFVGSYAGSLAAVLQPVLQAVLWPVSQAVLQAVQHMWLYRQFHGHFFSLQVPFKALKTWEWAVLGQFQGQFWVGFVQ
jgi:hypothetical protein